MIREDVYARMNNTKTIQDRDPFIGEGKHRLVVRHLAPFNHTTYGESVRCTFEVLSSTNPTHTPGSRVAKLWFLVKPAKFPSQPTDMDRFADFIRKIKGAPDGYQVGPDAAVLLRDRVNEQLARGMVIDALGINTSKNADKPWIDVRWTSVPQTRDQISAMRAQLDATENAPPVQAPVSSAAPAPVSVPMTQATSLLAQLPPKDPNSPW